MLCDVTNMSRTGLCNLEFGEVEGDLVGAARWTSDGLVLVAGGGGGGGDDRNMSCSGYLVKSIRK